ncbi:PssE/Cps14G family polysaccharide biosynthesis glycosyltransferase [Enterococcus faecium]|uniref:PssE/Cps14G family polysaccharide biosynthesis glycosyltransferase n=1 Tax=Enterococcus faecium TaxID=1352 RepID=UPI001C6915B3|nr:PssE/Cps14G family polysaccharide biosynthesis glycosyltransferase [Enterococcus faecium]
MIFITLGSQKFQFDRLLKAIDDLIEKGVIIESTFAQIGYSDYNYKPLNYSYKAFLNRDEFTETMQKAEMVITHGGTGAIIGAVKKGKRVIAVPRLAKYGEHVDDHQLQLIRQFDEMNIIYPCYELENLEDAVKETRVRMFNKYVSNTETIINSIEVLIEKI